MTSSLRHRLAPIAGVVALCVGLASVAAVRLVWSETTAVIDQPTQVHNKYDFFSAPRVEVQTPPGKTEFTCYDLNILPIWNELKKDGEFRDRTSDMGESLDCAKLLDVKTIDLNRDGRKEFLVRGKDIPLCGGTGNCLFWIFQKGRTRVRVLLAASDYADMAEMGDQLLASRTQGYADILLKGHFTAAATGYYTYRFDGSRYIESRCMYDVPNYDRQKEGSMEMITCEEFQRRLDKEIAEENERVSTKGAK